MENRERIVQMNLGKTLRDARLQASKSLIGIARELGYTNCALVQQIETGMRRIPKNRVADWSKAHTLSPDLLHELNESFTKQKRTKADKSDYNLMLILPWIVEIAPAKLLLEDLLRIVSFIRGLDVPVNQELIAGYLNGLVQK